MSTKSDRKLLSLSSETLRTLSGPALEAVAGGQATGVTLPTTTTTTTITRTLSLVRACVTV